MLPRPLLHRARRGRRDRDGRLHAGRPRARGGSRSWSRSTRSARPRFPATDNGALLHLLRAAVPAGGRGGERARHVDQQRRRRRAPGGDAAELVRHRAGRRPASRSIYYQDQVNPTVAEPRDGAARRRARSRSARRSACSTVLSFGEWSAACFGHAVGVDPRDRRVEPVLRRLRRAARTCSRSASSTTRCRTRSSRWSSSGASSASPTPMTDALIDLAAAMLRHRLPARRPHARAPRARAGSAAEALLHHVNTGAHAACRSESETEHAPHRTLDQAGRRSRDRGARRRARPGPRPRRPTSIASRRRWPTPATRRPRTWRELACEETGYGRVDHKTFKNIFCTRQYLDQIRARADGRRDRELPGRAASPRSPSRSASWPASCRSRTRPSTTLFYGIACVRARNAVVNARAPARRATIGETARILERRRHARPARRRT